MKSEHRGSEGTGQGITLVGSEEMQALEKAVCLRLGIDPIVLMENAGRSVARIVARLCAERCSIRKIIILCGMGNNGGDGLVAARHLLIDHPSLSMKVFMTGDPGRLKGDSLKNCSIARSLGITVHPVGSVTDVPIDSETLLVDALFGTGIVRPLTGLFGELIERSNRESGLVVAVDVPSGIDASTGRVMGCAIRADYTVTMGLVKRGLVVWPGLEYSGKIIRVPIGIPFDREHSPETLVDELIDPEMISRLIPSRKIGVHKISAGVVGVCAGSEGMLGAGLLAGQGAMKSGCGMVVWVLPSRLSFLIKPAFPEIVSFWPEPERAAELFFYRMSHARPVARFFKEKKCRALVIGPGLGLRPTTGFFLDRLVDETACSGVLDADALTLIARDRAAWKGRLKGWVLTPHVGEMARLAGCSIEEVEENRWEILSETAGYYDCTLVLKGPGTLVATPGQGRSVNSTGNPGLASAGSGDVLSGVIASFMAQGLPPDESARVGVFLHGLAGDLLARKGNSFFTAGQLTEYLQEAIRVILNDEWPTSVVDGD